MWDKVVNLYKNPSSTQELKESKDKSSQAPKPTQPKEEICYNLEFESNDTSTSSKYVEDETIYTKTIRKINLNI